MGGINLIMRKKIQQKNKAFTLLFAVLVSSLVLAVGASVITVALKQLRLSGSARDSQYAFYAANTGIECAIFWDLNDVDGLAVFATSSGSSMVSEYDNRPYVVECAGLSLYQPTFDCQSVDVYNQENWCVYSDSDSATTTFRIDPVDSDSNLEYCVDVIVSKSKTDDGIDTVIEARGYNTCETGNPRRIERGLRIKY